MKREFGKKLVEEFFPRNDLTHVIDTSGAYIPGHGTPTVILFGRNRKPVADVVRAVLGIKGEQTAPENASHGFVWRSIVKQIDRVGSQDEFVSTTDVLRTTFASHPWSIGGGGATDVKELIADAKPNLLSHIAESAGRAVNLGEDDCWIIDLDIARRRRIDSYCFPLVLGDCVRHWALLNLSCVAYPYAELGGKALAYLPSDLLHWLWPFRVLLSGRSAFGKSMAAQGKAWYEYLEHYMTKLRTPLAISFAGTSTHNNFVLDRGGKLFKHSAPIIKLVAESTEEDYIALLGLLNSSTACFWLRQVSHDKGGGGIGGGLATEKWEHFFGFDPTKMLRFPLTETKPLALARQLDLLGQQYASQLPNVTVRAGVPSAEIMRAVQSEAEVVRARMIARQEELDWQCYQLYGLLSDDLRYTEDDLPELACGQRAFEIVMARQMQTGALQTTWFERHGSKPRTDIPAHWPAEYRKLVERRIKVIETNKEIGLIEKPEYKTPLECRTVGRARTTSGSRTGY